METRNGHNAKTISESKFQNCHDQGQYCPKCQVPFHCLIGQTRDCHVNDCLKLDHNILPECTNCCCNSTIPSHYNKFSHFRLAALRSNAIVKVEKTLVGDASSKSQNNYNVENANNEVKKCSKLTLKRKHSNNLTPSSKRRCQNPVDIHICADPFAYAQNAFQRKQSVNKNKIDNAIRNPISLDPSNAIANKTELVQESQNTSIPRRTSQTTLTSFFKSTKVEQKLSTATPPSESSCKSIYQKNLKLTQNSSQESSSSVEIQNQRGRNCPFFKKIPGTSFSVDAFSYGSIPGVKYYFLSHFHYDHYCGLKANFPHPIYCSKVTANLVLSKIRVQKKLLHILNFNEPVVIESVVVTALDANHCPGSFMFLFELSDGCRFLHTGDFRASSEMETYPSLLRAPINELYLDTTYCDPHYKFPPQQAILDFVTSLVTNKVASKSNVLIVCGSYTIGKEKVFVAIAEALNCKIWANPFKLKVIHCLEDEQINSRLVSSPSEARVHVLPMNQLNYPALCQHLQQTFNKKYTEVLAIKPTGWEYNSKFKVDNINTIKPKSSGSVSIYGIPYSEHSSIDELKRFVQFIRPDRIIPTVSSSKEERNEMNDLFKKWLKS